MFKKLQQQLCERDSVIRSKDESLAKLREQHMRAVIITMSWLIWNCLLTH